MPRRSRVDWSATLAEACDRCACGEHARLLRLCRIHCDARISRQAPAVLADFLRWVPWPDPAPADWQELSLDPVRLRQMWHTFRRTQSPKLSCPSAFTLLRRLILDPSRRILGGSTIPASWDAQCLSTTTTTPDHHETTFLRWLCTLYPARPLRPAVYDDLPAVLRALLGPCEGWDVQGLRRLDGRMLDAAVNECPRRRRGALRAFLHRTCRHPSVDVDGSFGSHAFAVPRDFL